MYFSMPLSLYCDHILETLREHHGLMSREPGDCGINRIMTILEFGRMGVSRLRCD